MSEKGLNNTKFKRPTHQISFHTIAALQTIHFIGEEKVYG